jgi:cytochrome c-type biogenesis protein
MVGQVLTAFLGGMLSFLSPCVLPLVPAYLSMVSGLSVAEIRAGAPGRRRDVLQGTVLFLAGFTIVFVALGATASALGRFLLQERRTFEVIAGGVVIVMGLLLAGALRSARLQQERRFQVADSFGGWAAPVMGAAFAFGWTPCVGPILATILAFAASEATVGRGVVLLFAYSAGLGVPFIAAGFALSELEGVFAWFKRHATAVNAVAGAILVVFGVLLFTGKVALVAGWVIDFLEAVGLDRLAAV